MGCTSPGAGLWCAQASPFAFRRPLPILLILSLWVSFSLSLSLSITASLSSSQSTITGDLSLEWLHRNHYAQQENSTQTTRDAFRALIPFLHFPDALPAHPSALALIQESAVEHREKGRGGEDGKGGQRDPDLAAVLMDAMDRLGVKDEVAMRQLETAGRPPKIVAQLQTETISGVNATVSSKERVRGRDVRDRLLGVADSVKTMTEALEKTLEKLDTLKLKCSRTLEKLSTRVSVDQRQSEDAAESLTFWMSQMGTLETEIRSRKDSIARLVHQRDDRAEACRLEKEHFRKQIQTATKDANSARHTAKQTTCPLSFLAADKNPVDSRLSPGSDTLDALCALQGRIRGGANSSLPQEPEEPLLRVFQNDFSLLSANSSATPPNVDAKSVQPVGEFHCRKGEGGGSCEEIQALLSRIAGGLEDELMDLRERAGASDDACSSFRTRVAEALRAEKRELARLQAALGRANAKASRARAEQQRRADLSAGSAKQLEEKRVSCRQSVEEREAAACALRKIRREMLLQAKSAETIQDCVVGGWVSEPCSSSCGGGEQYLSREVLQGSAGSLSASCPPLQARQSCNNQECPADCEMSPWGDWGTCSRECGEGVKMRTRSVEKREKGEGGIPCGAEEELASCTQESCDADCALSSWSDWSSCSRACGGGLSFSVRDVEKEEKGSGQCPSDRSPDRLISRQCGQGLCPTTAECATALDLVVAVDVSTAVSAASLTAVRTFLTKLVDRVPLATDANAQEGKTMIGLIGFGGSAAVLTGLEVDETKIKTAVSKLASRPGGTCVECALAMASDVHQEGRGESDSTDPVVLVITDGGTDRPRLAAKTAALLKDGQESSGRQTRIVTICVGGTGGEASSFCESLSSFPQSSNVVVAGGYDDLAKDETLLTALSSLCPSLSPSTMVLASVHPSSEGRDSEIQGDSDSQLRVSAERQEGDREGGGERREGRREMGASKTKSGGARRGPQRVMASRAEGASGSVASSRRRRPYGSEFGILEAQTS
uniref:VWFA domain-containing protein n=1 Tax=Chromera velia CCMP2878 TaxID=1169474 RepID=A0A0G4I792_9ALVE|mmetsp:Transcript_47993/g.94747  ORF Transcript_47993/g.94747 Transcript_47993/m.94747 type:complete len:1008 (+) Transcript_47993:267-3290(+)|eukprot:Cvel_1918.t1-p1 / transcript=Cvel_1918.t1 / gene=Cvel_1918 / organism=Chromera_velia_CCMP2878 / gene_product=Spondin-1, putative / transcript_product=Spondin-1, putative / location=Cvel_scaffold72:5691-10465(-) / protein_length=1007 / sequence_SO=supercontig / SO=protein_coding / is_pseudo=false